MRVRGFAGGPALPAVVVSAIVVGALAVAGCGGGGASATTTTAGTRSVAAQAQPGVSRGSCQEAARSIERTESAHIEEGVKSGELNASTAAALRAGSAERESAAAAGCEKTAR